jgi:hypothetical protein
MHVVRKSRWRGLWWIVSILFGFIAPLLLIRWAQLRRQQPSRRRLPRSGIDTNEERIEWDLRSSQHVIHSSASKRPFPKRTVLVTRNVCLFRRLLERIDDGLTVCAVQILFSDGEGPNIQISVNGLDWIRSWLIMAAAIAAQRSPSGPESALSVPQLILITQCTQDETETRVNQLLKENSMHSLGLEFHVWF